MLEAKTAHVLGHASSWRVGAAEAEGDVRAALERAQRSKESCVGVRTRGEGTIETRHRFCERVGAGLVERRERQRARIRTWGARSRDFGAAGRARLIQKREGVPQRVMRMCGAGWCAG